jgi:hypothetical protein
MATVKQLEKNPAGPPGNFKYKFSCACRNGSEKPTIAVTAANDNEAKILALQKCEENCGQ